MGETEDLDNTMTAKARKRRMQRRAKHPTPEDDAVAASAGKRTKKPRMDEDAVSSSDEDSVSLPGTMTKDDLAKIPGVKQQARYVPAVPMAKSDLTLWRKEARRLRNRESAAASRQKTQGRITELEAEVGALTTKYQAALRRIVELEAEAEAEAGSCRSAWKSPKMPMAASPASPVLEPHPVSPPLSPRESFSSLASQEAPAMMSSQSFATMTSPSQTYPYHTTTSVKITPVDVDHVDTTTLLSRARMTWTPYWAGPQDEGASPPDTFMLPDAALAAVAEAAANDYPIAMDDLELGDFLRDAMTAEDAERHTDALCIFEEFSPPLVPMASP